MRAIQALINAVEKARPRSGKLVLTRKLGQKIIVEGGPLIIEVVRLKRGDVRLSFSGPGLVNRGEKFEVSDGRVRKMVDNSSGAGI